MTTQSNKKKNIRTELKKYIVKTQQAILIRRICFFHFYHLIICLKWWLWLPYLESQKRRQRNRRRCRLCRSPFCHRSLKNHWKRSDLICRSQTEACSCPSLRPDGELVRNYRWKRTTGSETSTKRRRRPRSSEGWRPFGFWSGQLARLGEWWGRSGPSLLLAWALEKGHLGSPRERMRMKERFLWAAESLPQKETVPAAAPRQLRKVM